jgi:hypothetical protein
VLLQCIVYVAANTLCANSYPQCLFDLAQQSTPVLHASLLLLLLLLLLLQ